MLNLRRTGKLRPIFNQNLPQLSTKEQQIEANLIDDPKQQSTLIRALNELEDAYYENKVCAAMIDIEKQKKEQNKQILEALQQKINKLTTIKNKNDKYCKNLAASTYKIKENFALSKVLMMEKIVRLQRDTDHIKAKQDNYIKQKNEKKLRSEERLNRTFETREKMRIKSLNQSKNLKIELQYERKRSSENKRNTVMNIKQEKQRLRKKSLKIQQFKRQRAYKNYLDKILEEKDRIQSAQQILSNMQITQVQPFQQTKPVLYEKPHKTTKTTEEQLYSFFATQATSDDRK